MLEQMLDTLVDRLPEPRRSEFIRMREMFDIFKNFHFEIAFATNKVNLHHPSTAVQCMTAMGLLIDSTISYLLNPFRGQRTISDALTAIGNVELKNDLMRQRQDKMSKLFQACIELNETFVQPNNLPYSEKFNGEHKVFHECVDTFIENISTFTEVEDSLEKETCAMTIFAINAIRHANYALFEDEAHVTKEAADAMEKYSSLLRE